MAQDAAGDTQLHGVAEDLWGNRIDLTGCRKGLTLIQPFSPANCGYCLVDGGLVQRNYLERNAALGGKNFHQCLFNPQMDVYTFLKHYRGDSVPVLTFPARLHDYHRDGFPFLIAFRDGQRIYSGVLAPYDLVFESLRQEFWPDQAFPFVLTSPSHIGTINCLEAATVWVVPDGDEEGYRRLAQEAERINKMPGWGPATQQTGNRIDVRHESELTDADLPKHLAFMGVSGGFTFRALTGLALPLRVDSQSIEIGPHSFASADVGLRAWFPNPRHPAHYVSLAIRGAHVTRPYNENWADFVVYQNGADGRPPSVLLRGLFDKSDSTAWRYSDKLAHGTGRPKCADGVCPAPIKPSSRPAARPHRITLSAPSASPAGELRSLGEGAARFPRLGLGPDGVCWAAWEERGDILLCSLSGNEGKLSALVVEDGPADSFHPVVAADGSRLWVFYLSDQDGFYRLYARAWDGRQLAEPLLLSGALPCDAITPAAAGDGKGRLVVAWTDWMANLRHLHYRRIENRTLGDISTAKVVETSETGGYVNAWYASLVFDGAGQVWAAWNQHYPALLGVCAGDLERGASSVTSLNSADKEERGGYPSIVVDGRGRRWVLWESFGWSVLEGRPQTIQASYYDAEKDRWTMPYTLSDKDQTMLAQTPRAAVDGAGVIWAVWSGRPNAQDLDQPWGVYVSRFVGEEWTKPTLVSPAGENARAPDVVVDQKDRIWLAWHAGVGDTMRMRILQCRTADGGAP
ncbi:MAG: hypothetical protein C4547_12225 [Phycisphaerales bacterium]|nr:MAG: hypothetical protein C4547_12225 [Phycisphaerales bacterium]